MSILNQSEVFTALDELKDVLDDSLGLWSIPKVIVIGAESVVRYLEEQGVMGIIGDCGFMLNFQRMVREGGYQHANTDNICMFDSRRC